MRTAPRCPAGRRRRRPVVSEKSVCWDNQRSGKFLISRRLFPPLSLSLSLSRSLPNRLLVVVFPSLSLSLSLSPESGIIENGPSRKWSASRLTCRRGRGSRNELSQKLLMLSGGSSSSLSSLASPPPRPGSWKRPARRPGRRRRARLRRARRCSPAPWRKRAPLERPSGSLDLRGADAWTSSRPRRSPAPSPRARPCRRARAAARSERLSPLPQRSAA